MSLIAQSPLFWFPDGTSLSNLGPMWALIGTMVALLLAPLAVGRGARTASLIALIGAVLTAAACFWVLPRVGEGGWAGMAPFDRAPMLVVDNFSLFFTLLLSLFLTAVIGLWIFGYHAPAPHTDMHRNAPEFFVLLLASALGMVMMVSTSHLLMILIAVELASLPSYALAGFDKRHRLGAEASLKYVLFGGITSAIMIYGASLLYGIYGTMDLAVIARGMASPDGVSVLSAIATFALMVGIGFKISAVPFHFWCPDVFEGAAIEVTTWLSVVSKAAGLGLLVRVVSMMAQAGIEPGYGYALATGIGLFATLTCTVGNLSAFRQTNIKRLLAYSSIAHAGYMLMAAAILVQAAPNEAHPAFSALAAYLIVYLFMNLGAFGCAAMVYWATGSESIEGYSNLGRRHTFMAIAMTICLVSLVGLPPLGGFAAKYWLLVNVWDAGFIWLVVVAVLNTALSLYYYVRVLRQMWLVDDERPAISAPAGGLAIVGLSAFVILWTGTLAIGTLRISADDATRNLYLGGVEPPAARTAAVVGEAPAVASGATR